jgi:hypothetical protein
MSDRVLLSIQAIISGGSLPTGPPEVLPTGDRSVGLLKPVRIINHGICEKSRLSTLQKGALVTGKSPDRQICTHGIFRGKDRSTPLSLWGLEWHCRQRIRKVEALDDYPSASQHICGREFANIVQDYRYSIIFKIRFFYPGDNHKGPHTENQASLGYLIARPRFRESINHGCKLVTINLPNQTRKCRANGTGKHSDNAQEENRVEDVDKMVDMHDGVALARSGEGVPPRTRVHSLFPAYSQQATQLLLAREDFPGCLARRGCLRRRRRWACFSSFRARFAPCRPSGLKRLPRTSL